MPGGVFVYVVRSTSAVNQSCLTSLAADGGGCKHLEPPRLKPRVSGIGLNGYSNGRHSCGSFLRGDRVKAEARRVERSESLDPGEHRVRLIAAGRRSTAIY